MSARTVGPAAVLVADAHPGGVGDVPMRPPQVRDEEVAVAACDQDRARANLRRLREATGEARKTWRIATRGLDASRCKDQHDGSGRDSKSQTPHDPTVQPDPSRVNRGSVNRLREWQRLSPERPQLESLHHLGAISASCGSSPAPKARYSTPSGPASTFRIVSLSNRIASHSANSTISSSTLPLAEPRTTT